MNRILMAACLALVPFEASAIVRYMVQDMTCAEVKNALERDGVAVLYRQTGRSGVPLYDRYVASQSFCQPGQETAMQSVPTADTNSCRVSKCIDPSRFGNR